MYHTKTLYIKAKGYISTLPIFSHISGLEGGMSTMLGWVYRVLQPLDEFQNNLLS